MLELRLGSVFIYLMSKFETIMKTLKYLSVLSLFILCACGSSERVITDDGTVYEVKGNTIINNASDVTAKLSSEEQSSIHKLLTKKTKAQSVAEKELNALEKAIEEQKQIEDKAKAEQRNLKAKLNALQDKLRVSQDVRDDYAEAKKRYIENHQEFENLKSDGKLSPNDIKDWKEKLAKLERDVNETKLRLEKIKG